MALVSLATVILQIQRTSQNVRGLGLGPVKYVLGLMRSKHRCGL